MHGGTAVTTCCDSLRLRPVRVPVRVAAATTMTPIIKYVKMVSVTNGASHPTLLTYIFSKPSSDFALHAKVDENRPR